MKSLLTLLLLGICTCHLQAQTWLSGTDKKQHPNPPPKVILFMLHLSTNKIEAMKKRGMAKDIPSVMEEDEAINRSIMADFASHFSFCPVYFFYDTCFEKAKQKHWDEITFYDYESLHMKKQVGTNVFTEYYFAEVGYPNPGEQLEYNSKISAKRTDQTQGDEDLTSARNYGINLYDVDFKPLKGKMAFIDISLRKRGPLLGVKRITFEGAKKLDTFLKQRYDDVKPAAHPTSNQQPAED